MSWLICLLLAQAGPISEPALPEIELAQQRGGLRLPSGLDLAITVQTQTAVSGDVVLRTEYKLDQGTPTLTVFAPRAGTSVPLQSAPGGAGAAAAAAVPTITYDRVSGIRVTQGAPTSSIGVSASAPNDQLPAGLVQVASGTMTDAGIVTEGGANGVRTVSLSGQDLTITHLAGNAIGSAIANSGSDRSIDTQTTVSIGLSNVSPDILGSAMFRVQDIALDAVALRTGG